MTRTGIPVKNPLVQKEIQKEGKIMGRSIEGENSFLQVLLKLIPSEVIAVFIFIQGVMPPTPLPHVAVTLLLVALTPIYLSKA